MLIKAGYSVTNVPTIKHQSGWSLNMTQRVRRPLYIATKNLHKIKELTAMLPAHSAWDLIPATSLAPDIHWEETGSTFTENARIKALTLRKFTKAAVLADDSGLEVLALGGEPGVYSSRYAGIDGDDAANNQKLLKNLKDVPPDQRQARFVCTLVFLNEEGIESIFEGDVRGNIINTPRGDLGFGYDPLFVVDGMNQTMAEMPSHLKNSLSHRKNAFQKWVDAFGSAVR